MRFIDEKGSLLGLMDASSLGYPPVSGPFTPRGEADLRSAIYAPEASYAEAASSAIAALFPEELDPLMAERLADRAFSLAPAGIGRGDDIFIADYASGPSGSAADVETAFLAGILAAVARRDGPRLLVADGSGSEGAALSEAIAGIPDLGLALLYPEGSAAGGVRSQRLFREGGQVRLLGVRGDGAAVEALIREAAGRSLGGAIVTAAGPPNPARFAARIVMLAAIFSVLRKDTVGDILMGIGAGDGMGLAACLWAWRLGLPLKSIVLSIGEKGILGSDPAGKAFIERFDSERPGVIHSLAMIYPVDRDAALKARDGLAREAGTILDLSSSMTLAAAQRALDSGLRGHVRIVVPMRGDRRWDSPDPADRGEAPSAGNFPDPSARGLRDARVDAEIGPSLAELERALTA